MPCMYRDNLMVFIVHTTFGTFSQYVLRFVPVQLGAAYPVASLHLGAVYG